MSIQSLDDLRKLREQHQHTTRLRSGDEQPTDQIEIQIGMSTCGIAAGARDTLNEFVKQFAEQNVSHARIIAVDCVGQCKYEPILQVTFPGENSVVYGNLTKEKVAQVVTQHLIGKTPVQAFVVDVPFVHA